MVAFHSKAGVWIGILAFSMALFTAGCGGNRASETKPAGGGEDEPKYGGVLTLPLRSEPPGVWDNMRVDTREQHLPNTLIYTTKVLTKPCRTDVFRLCPHLAEKWSSNGDFTEWTFKIRDDVNWHDGAALKPEDIKFIGGDT
ncbi:MAG: ABC transporter substrate-binding protein, partial [Chloroflexota bacterium]